MAPFGRGGRPEAAVLPFKTFNPNSERYRSKNALLASGYRVKQKDADQMRRLIQPWQARAYAYYDIVPEIKYAAQFYSRALAVLRLYPGIKQDDGTIEETNDPDAIEQLDRIQDPGGGRSGLLSSYGRLMFLAGEAILFVSTNRDTDMEQWEMLSTDELRITGAGSVRYKAPSMPAEFYEEPPDDEWELQDPESAIPYRIWKRHPRYSYLADSTMQGVLDICEELVLLTQVIRSRARSRMAGSGILLVNGKVTPVPLETVPDEDPSEDPFVQELTAAMTAPIIDEGAASAVTPLVVRVDTDELDNVMKHIQIIDPVQIYPETGLRRELIDRLAIGLDMPPEVLTGMGSDANHWTAWQIDEQTWKSHLQPVAQQLVDDLTSAFFQPMLRELGKADWDRYTVAYDATAVINHPDRSKDADMLYNGEGISKKAWREAKGFNDDDEMPEDELQERVGIKLRDGSYVKYGIPSVKAGGLEPQEGELLTSQGDSGGGDASQPGAVEPGAPPAAEEQGGAPLPEDVLGSGNGHHTDAFVERVMAASDLALYRARELAGARLRSYAKRQKTLTKQIDGVRPSQIAATIGRDTATEIGAPSDRELVAGARDFIIDALHIWGLDTAVLEPLGDRIEQHAARTLWQQQPPRLPANFINYVKGLKDAT